jgi:MarR family transcriptional regulator for hemolysin
MKEAVKEPAKEPAKEATRRPFPRHPSPAAGDAGDALDQSCMAHLLGYEITQANTACRKVFARHIAGPLKLSPVEFTILMLVAHNRDATQKQLSQALVVSAPNVTALLDRLTERDLITRVRNPSDRRSQHVRLTRSGTALVRQAREVSLTMEGELLKQLSGEERNLLVALLRRVAHPSRD